MDRAFDLVLNEILSGALSPGSKLKEPELSRRLGIKRGPLREAIRRLQGRNLVLYSPNLGARIVVHSPKDIIDIYEMREALESVAARLCAERMTDGEIADLKQAAEQHSPYDGTNRPEDAGRVGFHLQLIRGSRNNTIAKILDEGFFQLMRLWRMHFPWLRHSDALSRRDHQWIAEAIATRDGTAAELLMRNHIKRLREVIIAKSKDTTGI
ncbi:MAG: GntR family transcriptional regulator [Rhizobiaceae bacterium]|nr:GntR family transcriptional regulator [Rhizobiaceae bacterium]